MRLLVLGGTGFLGYHIVFSALSEGHQVSIFTRSSSGEEAPDQRVEALYGDRYGDLSALQGREWDVVLDTFSDPQAVSETARLFSGSAGVYGFVSGITNYHPAGPNVVSEDSPLRRPGDGPEDDPLQQRGIAKLRCESAVLDDFDGSVLIARPGIMVGPRDPTDRFSWWPARFLRALTGAGGEVLAPGDPSRPVQFTDARDLALWMVFKTERLAAGDQGERDARSIYNTVGPGRLESLSGVLDACLGAAEEISGYSRASTSTRVTWVDEDFLGDRLPDLPQEERPLWFPEPQIPFDAVDSSRALDDGLRFRSTFDTARDTLQWLGPRATDDLVAGLRPEREHDLIQAWREHRP